MRTTRLQKQHMNVLSSLPMGLDFACEKMGHGHCYECSGNTIIRNFEDNREAWIRQLRCRNGV